MLYFHVFKAQILEFYIEDPIIHLTVMKILKIVSSGAERLVGSSR